ncbi:hypothetical protein DFH07DRAFT_962544 [Mycena maculata]|uniref:F-box domain-containing protein n=1 Tax=Mycena maculata TaxID=230809 RepID=A0AAD7IQI8_9AGAR|nr:hypothetical protein DFH07DRAFT_962544 [Mycena maculata]
MAGPALPQELWDIIIDILATSRDDSDLEACSLVCRSLVAPAQSHLFYPISINHSERMGRFARLTSSSPHLLAYVRKLYMWCEEETVTHAARIPWTGLHCLQLAELSSTPPDSVLDAIKMLVSMPSLRVLEFYDCPPTEHIRSIFPCCNAGLQTFGFHFGGYDPPNPPLQFAVAVSETSVPRPKIRALVLEHSSSAVHLLDDPECPLDFSALEHVQCIASSNPGLAGFDISDPRNNHESALQWPCLESWLDLNVFPSLVHITVDGVGPTVEAILARLSLANGIVGMRLVLDDYLMGDIHVRDLQAVVLRRLPALRRMEVDASRIMMVSGLDETLHNVQGGLPWLYEKGILVVSFDLE